MDSPRRAPGAGTIEVLPSGRARFKLPLASGERMTSRVFASEAIAEAALDEMRARLCAGEVIDATTLGAWGWAWLGRRMGPNADTERGLWQHHVLPTSLAELPLQEVRAKALLCWAEGLRRHRKLVQTAKGRVPGEETISVQTQKLCWALVRRVLSAAQGEEQIAINPAKGLHPEWPVNTEDDPWSFLTEVQVLQLLSCQDVPLPARLHYQWAIGAGPRQRESHAVRWRDLDLALRQGTIRVSGTAKTTKGKRVRIFPLLDLALDALLRWRELAPSTHPDALVWPLPGRQGPRMRAEGDDFGWADRSRGAQGVQRGHRSLAGLPEGITYHALRHTCAAGLLRGYQILGSRKWSLEEVCDFLCHADRRTTERYAHIAGGGLAAQAARESGQGRGGGGQSGAGEGRQDGLAVPALAVHIQSTPLLPSSSSPVGDRGATRTRDLLFRKQGDTPGEPGVTPGGGLPVDCGAGLGAAARAHLIALDRGEPTEPSALAEAALLADPPLPLPIRSLAVQVLQGGDLEVRRSIDLAGALLDLEQAQLLDRARRLAG